MTATRRVHHLILAAAALVVAFAASCSKASRTAPKTTTIPNQESTGGSTFTLDLSNYATAPAGQSLTFTVLSGGGSITGSTYSNLFDTVGRKTVKVRASAAGDATDLTFVVDVVTSEEAVIQAGTGLVLLDRCTVHNNQTSDIGAGIFYSAQFITVSNSQGYVDTFKAALKRGYVIYERLFGGKIDLFVFNANTAATRQLGDDPNNTTDERFEASTSDGRIVFTSGTTADPNLYIHSAVTGLTRVISTLDNVVERHASVDANDIVYFERGPTAQRDIYTYDPSTDTLAAVSTDSANETVAGVVAGGGVVFSRNNGGGDVDLWFYESGVGLTQVAADVSTSGFQDGTLTYKGSSPNGMVIFEHTISGTDTDLYYWDPNTQTTTAVATNAGVRDEYNGVTSHDKIIYTHEVSSTDWDVHSRTIGGSDDDLSLTADKDVFQAITALNDVVIVRNGTLIGVWDDSAGAPVLFDSGATMTFQAALANGNVVYQKAGTGLRRWLATNAVATVSGDGTAAFAGATSDGNFVVKLTATAQDNLSFWDEATDNLTATAATTADERFVVSTTDSGAFVFSREVSAGAYELYVWDATNGPRKLTNTGLAHTFAASFSLDNR